MVKAAPMAASTPKHIYRRLGILFIVLGLGGVVMVESGCASSCSASCSGPLAEIRVGPSIAAVEACDSDGTCTRQDFGPWSQSVASRSFSVRVPDQGSTATLTLRGYGFDGVEVASGTAESSFGDSECGCKAPAKFEIIPNVVWADEQ
jgi:hypothetical protein